MESGITFVKIADQLHTARKFACKFHEFGGIPVELLEYVRDVIFEWVCSPQTGPERPAAELSLQTPHGMEIAFLPRVSGNNFGSAGDFVRVEGIRDGEVCVLL